MNLKNKIDIIIKKLEELYPAASCSLIYEDPLQLMIATQLAAQCTDARVNIVTKVCFKNIRQLMTLPAQMWKNCSRTYDLQDSIATKQRI